MADMTIRTDLEIAHSIPWLPITEVAEKATIPPEALECYGSDKAKVDPGKIPDYDIRKDGKLILVTAMTPTPAGEGKTTTSIGLTDGLRARGKNAIAVLREPSLGPVFGLKGGATGGGHAQMVPMEDINLHFTGDFHAISSAANLLAAMLDNHIYQGNELGIDPDRVIWKRAVDMNDRQLRHIRSGLGGKIYGVPRDDAYEITVASEVMAVFCLAEDLMDLKNRLGRIVVAYTYDGTPVTAHDLKAEGAMTVLLKDAIRPNLVQTLEGNPVLVHGGPFANIAHGCNSVIATRLGRKLADYTVTEAGFGSDLGGEKFLDIKCRLAGLKPDCVVIVATIRAIKYCGGMDKEHLGEENPEALKKGLGDLLAHIDGIVNVYHLPCVVALNAFPTDTLLEEQMVRDACAELGADVVRSTVWAEGGQGGLELADAVVRLCEEENRFTFAYADTDSIPEKLENLSRRIYHANGAELSELAKEQAKSLQEQGYGSLPICVAKTQYSFSDDPKRPGLPEDFDIHIRSLRLSAGAGFIVAYAGDILTMPGLPKRPAAEGIDIDENGVIIGLY